MCKVVIKSRCPPSIPCALPLGRHTERTSRPTPVPPNPAVEPLAVSFLNSFFCYELDIFMLIELKEDMRQMTRFSMVSSIQDDSLGSKHLQNDI